MEEAGSGGIVDVDPWREPACGEIQTYPDDVESDNG